MSSNSAYIWVLCCFIASIECFPRLPDQKRPAYVECVSSDECSFDSCCMLGMGRYSIPSCEKRLQLYETCRPASNEPVNTTVAYPDGQVVSLSNVHLIMCPCAHGLNCDHKTGQCRDFDGSESFNEISASQISD